MATDRVRIYVKKIATISHLNIGQQQMHKLDNVGLASRKDEISRGLNASGGQAKPLAKGYAIFKSRFTKSRYGRGRNKRDLNLRGDMMRTWLVRTVSNRQAVASWSTLKQREKARTNNRIEEFISWSRGNISAVLHAADLIMKEIGPNLIAASGQLFGLRNKG